MNKDECIVIDTNDRIRSTSSSCTKKVAHQFNELTPRGQLHRAFSVFLFDSKGRLCLQQRAKTKITFPNVWTNTCCSHPLYGQENNEVDSQENIKNGSTPGAKYAAIRKLKQELGIVKEQVPKLKFLTRLHYWAADVVTHGTTSPWGEHEIDYILFGQVSERPDTLKPNPEEVSDVRWVDYEELKHMMRPESGLLWSPWFRIIVERFLVHWWKDLNRTLTTDDFVDTETIHRFDPTREHMGGAGHAGPWLDLQDGNEDEAVDVKRDEEGRGERKTIT